MSIVTLDLRLPANELWQVVWFGSLTKIPSDRATWATYVFFKRFASPDESDLLKRVVSLAHIHLLPIGRCIEGSSSLLRDVRLSSERQARDEHLLDLSPENTSLIARSSLPNARGRSASASPDYDSNLLLVKPTSRTPGALIPCTTLFQLFWGVSSRIAGLVLSGKLEEPDRYMYDLRRSSLDANGLLTLVLRQQMTDLDAPYLASLYAEPHALEAGRHVARRLAAETARGTVAPQHKLEVKPPFARPMRLGGFCQTVSPRASGLAYDVLFISHIVFCDVRPKWQQLVWGRDNDGRTGKDGAVDEQPMARVSVAVADRSRVPLEFEDEPPARHQESAALEVLAPLQLKFPGIDELPREKLEKLTTTHKKVAIRVDPITGGRSAIDAKPGQGNDLVLADLTGGTDLDYDDLSRSEPDDVTDVHPRLEAFCDPFRTSTASVALAGKPFTIRTKFIHPYRANGRSSAPLFFEVPSVVDGKERAWLFRDPERRLRKRAVCIELAVRSEDSEELIRYVFDFEPRHVKGHEGTGAVEVNNGYLAAWIAPPLLAAPLTAMGLQAVIDAVARRGNPKLLYRPSPGIATRSFRHVAELDLDRLTQRVFSAIDQTKPGSEVQEVPSDGDADQS